MGIIFHQCSYEDECAQIDWIGTYTIDGLSSGGCTNTQGENVFPEELIIEAGSSSNTIIVNGTEGRFTNCFVELSFGTFDIAYNEFRLSQQGTACSSTYTKS